MVQRLTPVVLNLVIINVLIYLALLVMSSIPATKGVSYDYFTLHKSNLLGFRQEVSFGKLDLYLPTFSKAKAAIMTDQINHGTDPRSLGGCVSRPLPASTSGHLYV